MSTSPAGLQKWLKRHLKQAKPEPLGNYSQFGEDVIIDKVVGEIEHGYAVELGASDGVSISNTKALEDRGWKVLCIEANPLYLPALKANRKLTMGVACGAKAAEDQDFYVYDTPACPTRYEAYSALKPSVSYAPFVVLPVPVRTLDWCLNQVKFPRVDVLSLDVEGGEMDVLKGFNLHHWHPKIMVIENWTETSPLRAYCADRGYKLTTRLGVNDVFLKVTNG